MPKSEGYVSPECLERVARMARALKLRTFDLLKLAPDARVLDAGCGPGLDTVELAQRLGPAGSVVGVDLDEDMLARADQLAAERGVAHRVQHRLADAAALPFDDAAFDACRAERLLQVLPKPATPEAVVFELARLVRPLGRLVVADTDWATASMDHSDAELERRLLVLFADRMRPNGYAGRQLYRAFRQAGLDQVEVEIFPHVVYRLEDMPFGDWLTREAVAAEVATPQEMERWLGELEDREADGVLFGCVNMVVVSGVKAQGGERLEEAHHD